MVFWVVTRALLGGFDGVLGGTKSSWVVFRVLLGDCYGVLGGC